MESMSRAPGWSWKVLKQQEPCSQRMWKLSEKWRFVWHISMLPKSKKRKVRQHWVCFLRVACYSQKFERRVEEKNCLPSDIVDCTNLRSSSPYLSCVPHLSRLFILFFWSLHISWRYWDLHNSVLFKSLTQKRESLLFPLLTFSHFSWGSNLSSYWRKHSGLKCSLE